MTIVGSLVDEGNVLFNETRARLPSPDGRSRARIPFNNLVNEA